MTRAAGSRAALVAALLLAACGPTRGGPEVEVVIPAGAAFAEVTDSLVAAGLVRRPVWFRAIARARQVDRRVQAGVYRIPAGTGTWALLDILASPATAIALRFTVPEGLTAADVADLAQAQLGIPRDSVLAAVQDRARVDSIAPGAPSLEGFLFPETYLLRPGVTAGDLVRTMTAQFLTAWDPAWDRRLDTLEIDRADLVTLASIVEGEARVDEERPVIAGVYWNRLRRGMALQADPTVQYALQLRTGRRKPRLFEKDYGIDSPYNTYLHPGLPPGPVLSPGRRSLEATLYPADVPFLYFVAGPDGRHRFSRTYDEHLRAVAAARRALRAAQR